MFFGVTKHLFEDCKNEFIGELSKDWGFRFYDGSVWNNEKAVAQYLDAYDAGSVIECVIDRVNGTLSFVLTNGTKVTPFTDEEFKEGDI